MARCRRRSTRSDGLARTNQRPVPAGLGAAQQHAATIGQAAADALSSRARPNACSAAALDATELRPATHGSGACSAWCQDTNARGTEARCGGRLVPNCGCAMQRCIVNTAWQPPMQPPTAHARSPPARPGCPLKRRGVPSPLGCRRAGGGGALARQPPISPGQREAAPPPRRHGPPPGGRGSSGTRRRTA